MPINSLQLTNVGPFRHLRREGASNGEADMLFGIKLDFDANVNLLIGPNNVGKSTILQMLAITARGPRILRNLPSHIDKVLGELKTPTSFPFPAHAMLHWSAPLGGEFELEGQLNDFLYGDYTRLYSRPLEDQLGDPYDRQLIMDDLLGERSRLGYVGYYSPEIDSHDHDSIGRTRLYESLAAQEIFTGFSLSIFQEPFEQHDIQAWGQDGRLLPGSSWRLGLEKFGTPDGLVAFAELSHGTRSVLDWIAQFEHGMQRHYHDIALDGLGIPEMPEPAREWLLSNWKKMPGVFIIDEIDAHLHPSWQRRIIPTLQRHFPNVQIFASTHSPMMVAGREKGQVHLLKRDETGQVVWSRNEQDIIGWTADEIYRTFMGIDDPTDELTARHAEELRVLRNKDNLTLEDETRMQELRRLVNQDLLARGAHNAQQERFDQMMQEYLRSRMSDLSQDGA